jgi:thiol-disulfide isomerase/thioredoxin
MRVFVAWDTTAQALRNCLGGLLWGTLKAEFLVPSIGAAGGEILRDVVLSGIRTSDRVLAFIDRPNANVAFEVGLALGFMKKIALVHHCAVKPAWLTESPFANFLVRHVEGVSDIEATLEIPGLWSEGPAPLPADQPAGSAPVTLSLCPERSEGESCRRVQEQLHPEWKRIPEHRFSVHDLAVIGSGIGKAVWTIVQYGKDSDERDGAENASAGVLAGWLLATNLRYRGDRRPDLAEFRSRLRVLRSRGAREVADVELLEETFADLAEYSTLLHHGPERRATGTANEPARSPAPPPSVPPSPPKPPLEPGRVEPTAAPDFISIARDQWETFLSESSQHVILALFVVPWSSPCRQMAAALLELGPLLPVPARFVKITIQDGSTLVATTQIRQFPTLLVIVGGEIRTRIVGNRPYSALKASVLHALGSALSVHRGNNP